MKRNILIILQFLFIFFLLWKLMISENKNVINEQPSNNIDNEIEVMDERIKKGQISYKIIETKNNTWGYCIIIDSNEIILQQSIPGLPGNLGFSLKNQAQNVAKEVIRKMESGEFPPSITKDDLIRFKILAHE